MPSLFWSHNLKYRSPTSSHRNYRSKAPQSQLVFFPNLISNYQNTYSLEYLLLDDGKPRSLPEILEFDSSTVNIDCRNRATEFHMSRNLPNSRHNTTENESKIQYLYAFDLCDSYSMLYSVLNEESRIYLLAFPLIFNPHPGSSS